MTVVPPKIVGSTAGRPLPPDLTSRVFLHSAERPSARPFSVRLIDELAPLCVILLVVTIELHHIAHTSWLGLFLYSGDSLTLPLFRESLAQHQTWSPLVSTQLLIFPEGVIYALCSAITSSVRSSLVANAYANMLLVYAGVRMITPAIVARPGRRGAATALFCLCLVGFMLLEVQVQGANLQFATLNLLTTYYFGLVLGGLVVIGATVRQLRPGTRRIDHWGWALLVVAISTLTYGSDPLFLLWVTTPIVVTVIVVGLLRRARFREISVVIGCQVVSIAAGTALRRPFENAIGTSASSYVHLGELRSAIDSFTSMVSEMWSHPSERVELVVLGLILAIVVAQFVQLCRHPLRSPDMATRDLFVVVTFALVSPVVVIVGTLISGNSTSRYFIPVFVFPLLGLLPLVNYLPTRSRLSGPGLVVPVAIALVAVLATVAIIPTLEPLVDPADFAAGTCLSTITSLRGRTGVGDFWNARALDVYGSGGTHVLQVLPNLLPFIWLVNRGAYLDRTVSFVVVDRVPPGSAMLVAGDVRFLGRPAAVYSCPGIAIYSFPPGTPGYRILNDRLHTWVAAALVPKL